MKFVVGIGMVATFCLFSSFGMHKVKTDMGKECAAARIVLGRQYLHGSPKVQKDLRRALGYLDDAAKSGYDDIEQEAQGIIKNFDAKTRAEITLLELEDRSLFGCLCLFCFW